MFLHEYISLPCVIIIDKSLFLNMIVSFSFDFSDRKKKRLAKRQSSSSASSGHEKKTTKKGSGKLKKREKTKLNKCESGDGETDCREINEMAAGERTFQVDESAMASLMNETLRWSNICSDSEDEEERLKVYKENRRKRYAEAMQVKIVQRISGLK